MKRGEVHVTEKGGWQPVDGDAISGVIVDIDVTTGAYGPYPVLGIELEDGTVSVHAFHDQLRRKLDSRGAQVGETVTITYRGRAGAGAGTDAYLYDVHVGAVPKRFDYDQLAYTSEPAKQPETVPPSDVSSSGFESYGQPPAQDKPDGDDDEHLPF
jgi:hypothetical protein